MQKVMGYLRQQDEIRSKLSETEERAAEEKRDLTPDEQRAFEEGTAKVKKIREEMEAYIAANNLQDEYEDFRSNNDRLVKEEGPVDGGHLTYQTVKPAKGRDYRSMFGVTGRLDDGGWKSPDQFLDAVISGRYDERFMNTTVPSEGGFSVPEVMASQWLDASLEREILRPRCRVYPMTSKTLSVPGYDASDNSTALLGGYSGQWLAEGGTATRQQATLRAITLQSKKLAIFTQVSREILADGVNFEQQLTAGLADAISYLLDEAMLVSGTGAGQPLSILNSNSTVEVDREPGQPADQILMDNLVKMSQRLAPSGHRDALWVSSHENMASLMMLSVSVGVGGSFVPAVTSIGGRHTLFGRELIFSEKLPAQGELGSVMLISPSHYVLGLRQTMAVDRSNAAGWLQDLVDIRIIIRADGQPVIAEPKTPRRGNDTVSPFVVLGAA